MLWVHYEATADTTAELITSVLKHLASFIQPHPVAGLASGESLIGLIVYDHSFLDQDQEIESNKSSSSASSPFPSLPSSPPIRVDGTRFPTFFTKLLSALPTTPQTMAKYLQMNILSAPTNTVLKTAHLFSSLKIPTALIIVMAQAIRRMMTGKNGEQYNARYLVTLLCR